MNLGIVFFKSRLEHHVTDCKVAAQICLFSAHYKEGYNVRLFYVLYSSMLRPIPWNMQHPKAVHGFDEYQ
jgi:hypothetical protein